MAVEQVMPQKLPFSSLCLTTYVEEHRDGERASLTGISEARELNNIINTAKRWDRYAIRLKIINIIILVQTNKYLLEQG